MSVVVSREIRRADDRRYDEACGLHARAEMLRFVEEAGGQREAAKLLGVNQTTISRAIAPGNQPSLRLLIALARHTRRPLDVLLGLDPAQSPPLSSADR